MEIRNNFLCYLFSPSGEYEAESVSHATPLYRRRSPQPPSTHHFEIKIQKKIIKIMSGHNVLTVTISGIAGVIVVFIVFVFAIVFLLVRSCLLIKMKKSHWLCHWLLLKRQNFHLPLPFYSKKPSNVDLGFKFHPRFPPSRPHPVEGGSVWMCALNFSVNFRCFWNAAASQFLLHHHKTLHFLTKKDENIIL